MTNSSTILAPELAVSQWFNTPAPLTLSGLRGRPILLHAFQLLCPGCVSQSIPQIQRIEQVFSETDLQIIGLHTVFEHHDAMTPTVLGAFLHEYRIKHPVAVDMKSDDSPIPVTMQRYALQGTPSLILIGRNGAIIHQTFGVDDPIAVGARIAMAIAAAPVAAYPEAPGKAADVVACSQDRCDVRAHISD